MAEKTKMTREEKLQLNAERSKGVREAWKNEKALVEQGRGTRDWSEAQQSQLMQTNRVEGYDGHHMKSVSTYPQHAANPNNIQFLSKQEHIELHQAYKQTNGRYDPATKQMANFRSDELRAPQSKVLAQPVKNNAFTQATAVQNQTNPTQQAQHSNAFQQASKTSVLTSSHSNAPSYRKSSATHSSGPSQSGSHGSTGSSGASGGHGASGTSGGHGASGSAGGHGAGH